MQRGGHEEATASKANDEKVRDNTKSTVCYLSFFWVKENNNNNNTTVVTTGFGIVCLMVDCFKVYHQKM